jgi:hypothetical protein
VPRGRRTSGGAAGEHDGEDEDGEDEDAETGIVVAVEEEGGVEDVGSPCGNDLSLGEKKERRLVCFCECPVGEEDGGFMRDGPVGKRRRDSAAQGEIQCCGLVLGLTQVCGDCPSREAKGSDSL